MIWMFQVMSAWKRQRSRRSKRNEYLARQSSSIPPCRAVSSSINEAIELASPLHPVSS